MHEIISKSSKNLEIGGKAKNLILLDKIKVCPSFIVIDSSTVKNAFDSKGKFDKKLLSSIKRNLTKLKIKNPIIRSSFACEDNKNFSFAGLFKSYKCSLNDIPKYIKKVWQSQFSNRVEQYKKKIGLKKTGMAVIIQEYMPPSLGGVLFLMKRKQKQKSFLIEYSKDPEEIVLGKTFPKVLLLYEGCYLINDKSVQEDEKEFFKLFDLIKKIDNSNKFSKNLDIEFVISNGTAYIVQARPITRKVNWQHNLIFRNLKNKHLNVEDISERNLNIILKKIGLNIPYTKIKKQGESILVDFSSYGKIIDQIKEFSSNKQKTEKFIKSVKKYQQYMIEQSKKSKITKKIIVVMKNYYLNLSFYDYLVNLSISILGNIVKEKNNLSEEEYKEYVMPFGLSISSENIFRILKNQKPTLENPLHNYQSLQNLNSEKQIQLKKRLSKIRKTTSKKKTSDLETNLKKLIWLHDANDYYVEIISYNYTAKLNLLLKQKNINIKNQELNLIYKLPFSIILNSKLTDLPNLIKDYRVRKSTSQIKETFPLTGLVVVNKDIQGIAKVIKSRQDLADLSSDDILIARDTHPSYVGAMIISKGIITEAGGLTSHAAIVSRELNIPCIVGVKGCRNLIKTGDKIKMHKGKILKIK
ncbi:hypothetical protein KY331_01890 [Candidatus Woesearchaeota archaeon]|nr:hypothetical protein [Candidatus Woesearchaeota archaeon]